MSFSLYSLNITKDTLIQIFDKKHKKVEVFQADSRVLSSRALSDKWRKNNDIIYNLELEMSCDVLKEILEGICNGSIILSNIDPTFPIDLLDFLFLHDFMDLLKFKLLEGGKEYLSNNEFIYALKASHKLPYLRELYLVCQDMVAENPKILFDSPEFSSINEELLLNILKLDMICAHELIVFNKLIKWGIANTPNYSTITYNTS
ncbi:24401_t:CDS:2 [Dentiscutata erythropus]|uniref:24401_t:CDS:1 n=1 Tax=Dentiscutata erythropus TaxID=1348616 RepID=A0A9N9N8H9_9GLOM|nr:24401_t:CDS:2 [Dentiscutata erythropus]